MIIRYAVIFTVFIFTSWLVPHNLKIHYSFSVCRSVNCYLYCHVNWSVATLKTELSSSSVVIIQSCISMEFTKNSMSLIGDHKIIHPCIYPLIDGLICFWILKICNEMDWHTVHDPAFVMFTKIVSVLRHYCILNWRILFKDRITNAWSSEGLCLTFL